MRLSALNLALLLFLAPALPAVAADDLDETYQRLKEAQSKNDAVTVKQLATELHRIAHEIVTAPAPTGEGESEAWTTHVANARSADLFGEYALYATAIQSPPATLVELVSTLEQQNPK